jgi:hypothetical protein
MTRSDEYIKFLIKNAYEHIECAIAKAIFCHFLYFDHEKYKLKKQPVRYQFLDIGEVRFSRAWKHLHELGYVVSYRVNNDDGFIEWCHEFNPNPRNLKFNQSINNKH